MNKYEYKIFLKSTVGEEVERAKYSELIICPLIKYIYFSIKGNLERKEERDARAHYCLFPIMA